MHKIRLIEEVGLSLSARKKTAGAKMERVWDEMLAQVVAYCN